MSYSIEQLLSKGLDKEIYVYLNSDDFQNFSEIAADYGFKKSILANILIRKYLKNPEIYLSRKIILESDLKGEIKIYLERETRDYINICFFYKGKKVKIPEEYSLEAFAGILSDDVKKKRINIVKIFQIMAKITIADYKQGKVFLDEHGHEIWRKIKASQN